MMRRLAIALALLLLTPVFAGTAPLDAYREVLPNGIVLLIAERPSIPIVIVRAYARAGSVFDPPAHPGLANLTAGLLTRGTAKRSGPDLDEAIEFVGGSLGASAGRDGVTVSLDVLKRDLPLGLDLLAEVLLEPTFPEAELERTVKEIQASLRRSENDPTHVAARTLTPLLYPGHAYGHPVAGTEASVGALTRAQVVDFYRRHYGPEGSIIAVVGDVRRDDIVREFSRRLGHWTPSAQAPRGVPPVRSDPPAVARAVTRELTQATVYLGRPVVRQDHPDYYPLQIASYILGGGSASRLYSKVREEAGLAYWVGSHVAGGRYGAAFVVSLQSRTDGAGEALRLVRTELGRMGREPVSDQELGLAKAYLIGSFPLRMDTSSELANLLVTVEELGLGLDHPDRFKERVGKVTAADVLRVARTYLDPAAFSTVTVGKVGPAEKSP
ncbi:MAG: insulinase family protein [Candidatus Rokubacteria bacterium]|nr:insulinase family protein [Candidatus Rokubacteria bacterium]